MWKAHGLTLNPEKGQLAGPVAWPRGGWEGGTHLPYSGAPPPRFSSQMSLPSWAVREGQGWGEGGPGPRTCRDTLSQLFQGHGKEILI